ncbi:putative cytochrome b5 [Colletotrichum siamense]|uniref:Cytochrome b5 n=1 Tax=Colletotrichum siamense TaxID=690259 RepID=A0A9P5K879_COLSI|nr:putative cytochrome b5 [Colletotrichum siamense]KAF4861904.1 putative cytochrome b5 [Colletotrichum siamense]
MDDTELPFTIPTHPPLSPSTASLLPTPIPLPCPPPPALDTLFHAEHGQLFNLSGLRTSESLILQDLDPYSPSPPPNNGFIHVNEAKWHRIFHRSRWASTTCHIANAPLHIDDDIAWGHISPAIELADRMLQQALSHNWLLAMLSAAGHEAVHGVSATVDGRGYANATIYRGVPGPVTHEARVEALKVLDEIAESVFWGFHHGDEAPGLLGKMDTIFFHNERWAEAGYSFETAFLGTVLRNTWPSSRSRRKAYHALLAPRPETPAAGQFQYYGGWAPSDPFVEERAGVPGRVLWEMTREDFWEGRVRKFGPEGVAVKGGVSVARAEYSKARGYTVRRARVLDDDAGFGGRIRERRGRLKMLRPWYACEYRKWCETPFAEFQMRSWVPGVKGIGRSVKCEAGVIAAAKKMASPFGVEEQVCGTRIEGERSGRGFWRAVGFLAMAAVPVRRGVETWEDESVPAYPEVLVHGSRFAAPRGFLEKVMRRGKGRKERGRKKVIGRAGGRNHDREMCFDNARVAVLRWRWGGVVSGELVMELEAAMRDVRAKMDQFPLDDVWLDFGFRMPEYSGEVFFPVGYEDDRVDEEDADLPSWAIARSGIAGEEVIGTVIKHYSPGEIGNLQSLGPGRKVVLWQDEDETEIQVYDVSDMFPDGWDSDARDAFTTPSPRGRMLSPNIEADIPSQFLNQQPLGQAMLWRQAEDVRINDGNEGRPNWIALGAEVFDITNLHLSPDLHTLHHILSRTRNPVEAIDAGFHPDLILAALRPYKVGWLRDEMSGPRRRDRVFTPTEVKWFAARETGMYIIINGGIYDFTGYCDMHPGGASFISQLAGQDATAAWRQAHGHGVSVSGVDVQAALEELKIGRVVPEKPPTEPLSSSQIRIRDCVFGRENIKPEQTQALNDLGSYWGTDCTPHLEAQSPHWVLTKLYDTRDFIVAKIAPTPEGFPMTQETLREFDGKETHLGFREAYISDGTSIYNMTSFIKYTSPSPLTSSLLTRAGTTLTSSPSDTELRTWLQTSCRHRIIAYHDHRKPSPGTSQPRWKTDVQRAPHAPAPGHFPKVIKAANVEMNWARALQGDAASPGPNSDIRPTQASTKMRAGWGTRGGFGGAGGKGRVEAIELPLLNQKPQSVDGDVVMEDVQPDGWTVVGKKGCRRTRKRR